MQNDICFAPGCQNRDFGTFLKSNLISHDCLSLGNYALTTMQYGEFFNVLNDYSVKRAEGHTEGIHCADSSGCASGFI